MKNMYYQKIIKTFEVVMIVLFFSFVLMCIWAFVLYLKNNI